MTNSNNQTEIFDIDIFPYEVINSITIPDRIPDGVALIQAPKFWDKGKKGDGVVIAVIDTGCDINHPDLKDRIIGSKNFTTDDSSNPNIVTDYVGHGTHVCGIIAANENASGIIGVAPKAKLLILKALSKRGGQYAWLISAIDYAISQKVDIISMSLGGPYAHPDLDKIIKKAVDSNILIVAAAGNAGDGNAATNEISYPAGFNESISVGSVNIQKISSRFSSSNNQVDLVAPGQGLSGRGILSTAPGGGYVELQGTSMATPHVAGALALIINWAKTEFKRPLTEAELYAQLIKKTITLGYPKEIEGNGLLFLLTDDMMLKLTKESNIFS